MSTADPNVTANQTTASPYQTPTEQDRGLVENALLLGIDLGTSRSAIVSMHGPRKCVESFVGWPKDTISRKHLKSDILFGKAALDNRLALDLYRPLEKGVIKGTHDNTDTPAEEQAKNLEAAAELLRHLITLVEPTRDEVLFGVIGVPAEASDKNKQGIIDATRGMLDSVMIVSEPFTVAYGLERFNDVLVIDIGAGTTDLCRMHGTIPSSDDQISLEIAGDAIDQKLYELIKNSSPQAQITVNMCKQFKEQYGFVSNQVGKIEVLIPVDGKPVMHEITSEIKQACSIIVHPILDAIHRLVSSFDPEFQERLRNNIILSGGGGLLGGLNKQIKDGLKELGGGHVTVAEDPLFAGASGALQLAADMPAEYWQQLR
jgi:rod shape-determining protein MreB